jgi:pimeloyl-ACP methyl ester carboxylesterase
VSGGSRQGARWLEQLKFLATGSTLLADLAAEPDLDDAALARLACPVTLVYGDRSGCRAAGERLQRVIPGARLEILRGGHFLPTEAAGALTDVIVEAVHG